MTINESLSPVVGPPPGLAGESPHDPGHPLSDFAASFSWAAAPTPEQARENVARADRLVTELLRLARRQDTLLAQLRAERSRGLAPASQLDELKDKTDKLVEPIRRIADALLKAGVKQRVHTFLDPAAAAIIAELVALGAEEPHRNGVGIWICRECRWVWRPARKRATEQEPKCERCHESPHARARRFDFSEHEDGHGWTVTYLSGNTEHYRTCARCAITFEAHHKDQEACSERCHRTAKRRRAAGQLVADTEAAETFALLAESRDLRLRPHVEQRPLEQLAQAARWRTSLNEEQRRASRAAALGYLGR